MKILALALFFHMSLDFIAVLPRQIEVPTVKVKRSRGKGKGKKPYFSRFM